MKRLLLSVLLLSALLLASCANPGAASSSSDDHYVADPSLPPVQTFQPIVTDEAPSEELLFKMFNDHPRYSNYEPLDWAVADDGEFDLLGIIMYEDPEEQYCYYMAYVLRDRIRPIAIGTEEAPMWGKISNTTYLGFGRFSFQYEDYNTGEQYMYYPSFGSTGGEMLVDLQVEAMDDAASADSSAAGSAAASAQG